MIKFFKRKKEPTLQDLAKQIEKYGKEQVELRKEFEEFKKEMRKAVTKIGIVRFNPFHETGGNQSFTIALLNENNDGLVITSHYLKDYNRIYAKSVKEGKSAYTLSQEEKEAIDKAIRQEI